jgi:hypothetical protein
MRHDVSFIYGQLGKLFLLTERSSIFSESDSFVKGDVASDHVSGHECVAVGCPRTRLGIDVAVIAVISSR